MRPAIAPVAWSIALHAALAALIVFGLTIPKRAETPVVLPIDAVVVDDAVLQAAGRQRELRERVEAERRERAAAEAEERRLEEERLRQEQERQQAEAQARVEAEQRAQADADAKRKAEADAKRKSEKEAAAKAAAEKKRAEAEQRDRQAREAELRARLAEEETRQSAGFQSLKASYIRAIQAHVERRWFEPPGIAPGLSCTIFVTQIPGGDVVNTRFGPCNGNAAVRQSIENAVRNASPLPAPPQPALFEREVELVFTPKEGRR
ncbi:MAG TPA: cell envelope integrity protein TolA [Steroidobacteraceae bacterium]|jgi:colicin import membrane protein|nr:cell envelope integrity protein TolA [Steroidobacteraceae bacterium]